ncbi:protein smf [Legionella busanensis]|uniref:Protein smf n=1 Tax=Legionella busanensis TaxID=190655 RepID=A0A378JPZ6_9GAMM|nr:DNA-processing protein DprA [Legionella busanensis]STX52343.1 protein smf [Legionella busanensis]
MFAISPSLEIGSYEYLLDEKVSSYKQLVDLMKVSNAEHLIDLVDKTTAEGYFNRVYTEIKRSKVADFNVFMRGTADYLTKLNDAEYPLPLLYYRGNLDLLHTRGLAIVGARAATEEGKIRTKKLVKTLVEHDFTIISGLAAGIDTAAHTAAIQLDGRTIAVIGTPITHFYPPQNRALQEEIAKHHLLISQVPIIRYEKGNPNSNRFNFPERNKTMSAISEATVIVEASNTSGSLTQAKATLKQGRKLFILNNNFENQQLTWPQKFEELGAIRVRDIQDILNNL